MFRFGKMSIDIRQSASPLPSATATTSTMTVSGRRMAKRIGFMAQGLARTPTGERDGRAPGHVESYHARAVVDERHRRCARDEKEARRPRSSGSRPGATSREAVGPGRDL